MPSAIPQRNKFPNKIVFLLALAQHKFALFKDYIKIDPKKLKNAPTVFPPKKYKNLCWGIFEFFSGIFVFFRGDFNIIHYLIILSQSIIQKSLIGITRNKNIRDPFLKFSGHRDFLL